MCQVEETLFEGGFRTEDGSPISQYTISKYVVHNKLLLEILPARPKTNLQEYAEQFLEAAEPNTRITTKVIYEHYAKWCLDRNELPVRINRLSSYLVNLGFQRSQQSQSFPSRGYLGLRIKGANLHVPVSTLGAIPKASSQRTNDLNDLIEM